MSSSGPIADRTYAVTQRSRFPAVFSGLMLVNNGCLLICLAALLSPRHMDAAELLPSMLRNFWVDLLLWLAVPAGLLFGLSGTLVYLSVCRGVKSHLRRWLLSATVINSIAAGVVIVVRLRY